MVLVFLIPLLDLFFRLCCGGEDGHDYLSALVAHTGWHWMIERIDHLRQYR